MKKEVVELHPGIEDQATLEEVYTMKRLKRETRTVREIGRSQLRRNQNAFPDLYDFSAPSIVGEVVQDPSVPD